MGLELPKGAVLLDELSLPVGAEILDEAKEVGATAQIETPKRDVSDELIRQLGLTGRYA